MGKLTMDFSALFKKANSSFMSINLIPGAIIDKDMFPDSSMIKLKPKIWIIDSLDLLFGRKFIMNEGMLRREKEHFNNLSDMRSGVISISGNTTSIRRDHRVIVHTLELTPDFNYKVIDSETWEY